MSYESTMGNSSVLILAKMAIRTPTEIQAACIPPLLSGESVHLTSYEERC